MASGEFKPSTPDYGEKGRRLGFWRTTGYVLVLCIAGSLASGAAAIIKGLYAPVASAPAQVASGSQPTLVQPLPVAAAPAPGFSRVTLEKGAVRFEAPSGWDPIETVSMDKALDGAAPLSGASVRSKRTIYSTGDSGVPGAPPAATLHVLRDDGPAPTQVQLRRLIAQKDPTLVELPTRVAAKLSEPLVPNLRVRPLRAEWADNGKLLCQHVRVEVAGPAARKISDQWECFNSSSTVTLTAQYNAPDAALYAPLVQHAFDTLEFALDSTVRLR